MWLRKNRKYKYCDKILDLSNLKAAERKRAYRGAKQNKESNDSRQADLNGECQRKAKSRRLTKEKLKIKNIEERKVLIEKVNQLVHFYLYWFFSGFMNWMLNLRIYNSTHNNSLNHLETLSFSTRIISSVPMNLLSILSVLLVVVVIMK